MRKWYSIELFDGYVTNKLTSFLKNEGIKYEVSDCTPLPNSGKYMLHIEAYCTEDEAQAINAMIDVWEEEEKSF